MSRDVEQWALNSVLQTGKEKRKRERERQMDEGGLHVRINQEMDEYERETVC